MSMGNLAWVVLLECLRSGDWATASALVSAAVPDHRADVEAAVQRRLAGPLPPGKRPTFGFDLPLLASTFAPKSGAGQAFDKLAAETNEIMSRLALGPDVAACSCGAIYIAATWELLELVGRIDDRDEGGMLFEQRNCVCGSTVTRELVLEPCAK